MLSQVNYSDSIPILKHNSAEDERKVFLNKTTEWAYEKEWRYISNENLSFFSLNENTITRIFLGARFKSENLEMLEFWASVYNPARQIPIVKNEFCIN